MKNQPQWEVKREEPKQPSERRELKLPHGGNLSISTCEGGNFGGAISLHLFQCVPLKDAATVDATQALALATLPGQLRELAKIIEGMRGAPSRAA